MAQNASTQRNQIAEVQRAARNFITEGLLCCFGILEFWCCNISVMIGVRIDPLTLGAEEQENASNTVPISETTNDDSTAFSTPAPNLYNHGNEPKTLSFRNTDNPPIEQPPHNHDPKTGNHKSTHEYQRLKLKPNG